MRQLEPSRPGLDKLATSLLRGAPPEEAPLIAWPLACGPKVAERTRAVRFEAQVLTVEVPDSGWREQLRDLLPEYLSALNRLVGGSVGRIQFVLRNEPARESR